LGRKEDNIARAQAIMNDPRYIRNIGTAAHIDHGKCMSGSAMVFSNGSWLSADTLYRKYAKGQPVFSDRDNTVYTVGGQEITVSLNTMTMKLEKRPITHVWKIRNDEKLLKIKPVNGRDVTVTPEHRFVVLRDGNIMELKSCELKLSDRLIAPAFVDIGEFELNEASLLADEKINCRDRNELLAKLFAELEEGNETAALEKLFGGNGESGVFPRLQRGLASNLASLMLDRLNPEKISARESAFLRALSLAMLRFGLRAELEPRSGNFLDDISRVRSFISNPDIARCNAGDSLQALNIAMMEDGMSVSISSALPSELVALEIESIEHCFEEFVYDFTVEETHNLLVEGLIVHNTTLSDNLIAGAGMMSEELAGKQLLLDYDEQEQARGITINAANASMVHEIEGKYYLINLIDTPGHVDFGGDVTRAMRAIDGVIILVDSVEQVMPQTETVIRQALKERVRPILFINKVDRLINELKVTPEDMQRRFISIINEVNKRIYAAAPEGLKKIWSVRVEDDTVLFGSAYNNWAISASYMKKTGMTFPQIYEHLRNGDQKTLAQRIPLHKVVLESVVKNHPNPIDAQKLRIPAIWKGDITSEIGQALIGADPSGPTIFMATKIIIDQHAGEVAVGRLFSGTLKRGQELYISGMPQPNRVQTVALSVGADRIPVEEIKAGNIAAVTGLKDAISGSTVSSVQGIEPFEKMTHYSEPVVTVAIEAKQMKDLPKLIDVLRNIAKADPSITVEINQETGEHLLSGMGELHLEVTQYRIVNDYKCEINASKPIVVYRESIEGKGGPFEGKSPNKHNRFYIEVEPLEESIVQAITSGEIRTEGKIKDAKALAKKLQDIGMERDEARGVQMFVDTNVFIDYTKGIQYLFETMELCKQSFEEAMRLGPLAQERVMKVKVKLVDAKLHEDSIHRGPAQVIPATRSAIYGAMAVAGRALYEPVQKIYINVPPDVMGDAIREIQQRRGIIADMRQDGENTVIEAKAPVAEMFGFASAIRSATQGRALWSTENAGYEKVPKEISDKVVPEIRKRKGLSPQPYDANYYAE
jgi:elongation factor 2